MDEAVALDFVADVEEAVASVRELASSAQDLAVTAKEAQDGVAGIAAPATEAAAGVDEVTASADKASESLGIYVDAAGRARLANGRFATSADLAAAGLDKTALAAKGAGDAQESAARKSGAAAESGLRRYRMALVGIAVGAAVAVGAAGKFQDQTTHLVTDAGESAKNLAMVQQGILAVSAATGTSATDITNAMYHIESSGFHGAAGLAVLKTAAEGAKVGGADLDTTSKALMGTLTAYYGTSMTAAQATQRSTSLMNQLIATVGSGDMRMQDLAAAIHSVAPVAATAGISFAQVGGAIATMTAQGMSADQVTQDLGHVIGSLSNPTHVMAIEMKAMGLNANTVARNLGKTGLSGTIDELRNAVLANTRGGSVMLDMLRGMSPAAQDLANKILAGSISTGDLAKAMKELNPQQYALVSHFKSAAVSVTGLQQTYTAAMSKMLGGQMGLNVGLMLTGKHMQDVTTATKNIAAEGAKASGVVDNWSTIQGTFKFKLDQAKVSLQDTGIALGTALLPAVTAVLGPTAHFLALIASNRAASIALATVVGGLLAGALGMKLAKGLKDAGEGIKALGEGTEWLIGKLAALRGEQEAQAVAGDAAAAAQGAQDAANGAATAELEAQTAATEALTVAKEEGTVATEAATVAQGELDVAMDANPIGLIIIAIAALIAIVVLLVTHWHAVEHAFDVVRHAISAGFDQIRHAVASIGDDIIRPFEKASAWIRGHWKLILTWLLFPVLMAVFEIRTHTHQIAHAFDKLRHDVAAIIDGLGHDIMAGFDRARHNTAALVMGIVHDTEANFAKFRHAVAAVADWVPREIAAKFGQARHDAAAAWDGLVRDVEHALAVARHAVGAGGDAVVRYFQQLPGRMLRELKALPGQMLRIGEDIVNGLIRGVENAAGNLLSMVSNLAGRVEAAFTNPLSILSPSRVMAGHGADFVNGIISGVKSRADALKDTVSGLAAGLGAPGAVIPAGNTMTHAFSVSVNAQGTPAGSPLQSPEYQQELQAAVQEVTLKYAGLNPSNGLSPAWGH